MSDPGVGQAFDTGRPTPLQLARRLPAEPGVYRFSDDRGRVLYLGRAVSLRRRVVSYWGDLGDRGHLAPMVARTARVEAVVCDSAHEAAWLERNLLRASLPSWNRAPSGGQEKEVWIRLSESARTPGLTVVHRPAPSPGARHFGPYLGGLQVRRAVSGLSRVLPLYYAAGSRSDGASSGSESPVAESPVAESPVAVGSGGARSGGVRSGGEPSGTSAELARAMGVSAAERDELARVAASVLDRDQAAVALVRERLTARRDAAAATLAFEFAGRLQRELEALAWVTAEQKVTRAEPDDVDVCGWADGLLIRFAIRGGRLSGWTQRACGAAAAGRHLAATPPEWAGFACRNAELAARLAAGRPDRPDSGYGLPG